MTELSLTTTGYADTQSQYKAIESEVPNSLTKRTEIAQQKMTEVLTKFPGIGYDFGKGEGRFLLFRGSEISTDEVPSADGTKNIPRNVETHLLLSPAGYRTLEFYTYENGPSSYEQSADHLHKILDQINSGDSKTSSYQMEKSAYSINGSREGVIFADPAPGVEIVSQHIISELSDDPTSRAYNCLRKPDQNTIQRLLENSKQEIGHFPTIEAKMEDINSDINTMEAIQI